MRFLVSSADLRFRSLTLVSVLHSREPSYPSRIDMQPAEIYKEHATGLCTSLTEAMQLPSFCQVGRTRTDVICPVEAPDNLISAWQVSEGDCAWG